MQTVLPYVSCVGKRGVCRVPCGGLSEHYPPSTPGKRFDLHPHFIVKIPGLQVLVSIMLWDLPQGLAGKAGKAHSRRAFGVQTGTCVPAPAPLPLCYLSYFRDPRNLINACLHGNQLRRRGVQGRGHVGTPCRYLTDLRCWNSLPRSRHQSQISLSTS